MPDFPVPKEKLNDAARAYVAAWNKWSTTLARLEESPSAVATSEARKAGAHFNRARNRLWGYIQDHIESKPLRQLGQLSHDIDARRGVLEKVWRHVERKQMIQEFVKCLDEGVDGNFLSFIDVVIRSRAIDEAWSHPEQISLRPKARRQGSPKGRYVFAVHEPLEHVPSDGDDPIERVLPVNSCFVDVRTIQEWAQVVRVVARYATRREDTEFFVAFFIFGHSWNEIAGTCALAPDQVRMRVERLMDKAGPELRAGGRAGAFWMILNS